MEERKKTCSKKKNHLDVMMCQVRSRIHAICSVLEYVVGIFVFAAIIIAIIQLVPAIQEYWYGIGNSHAFTDFLEKILAVVVGIEFLQMLCRPSSENVLETLIFLMARHMVLELQSPINDFIAVVSICLLCLLRRYLHDSKRKHEIELERLEITKEVEEAEAEQRLQENAEETRDYWAP